MVIPSRMCPMHMHIFPQNGWSEGGGVEGGGREEKGKNEEGRGASVEEGSGGVKKGR